MSYFDMPLQTKPLYDKLDKLSDEKKWQVFVMWQMQKKDPSTALILAIGGLSLFYFGKAGLGILLIVTLGGLGIWWLVELINAKRRAETANLELMTKLLTQMV